MRTILRQLVAVLALAGIVTTMVPSTFAVSYTAQAAADKLAASGFIVDQSATPAAYRLADNLLRQEAVGVAAKIRGVLTVSIEDYQCTNHFSDVNASTGYIASLGKGWVCRSAELSANAGITNAANATFRPADNLTRYEALVFALRAADLLPSGSLTQAAIIQVGVDNGLITSSAGFNANAAATRGEYFQYVVRGLDAAESTELCEILGICPNPNPNPNPNPTPTGGAVSVSLNSGTPASTDIADAANANFTKFNISSGSSATSISTIYVTRTGLSTNTMVENIKILDENGVSVSSTGSLNANNKAQITFSPALVIPANTTKAFFIRAGITDGTGSGNTVALGIESAADIISTASITGSFPVRGNLMTTLNLTIGTLTLDEDGTVIDSQPNGGDKDVVINKFSLATGSVETVTVKQIAVERQGSASATDTVNIELFDVSTGTSVGTAATWDANGLATFNNLNIFLDKGQTKRFEIRVDIIGGSGLTVNGDLTDGSDVRVQAIGNTYGFYLTPTNSMTNGQGASNQTIQSGTLTITKSVSTPASGNISAGSDRHLATFDFQVLGEPMKITSVNIDSTLTTMVYSEITNVKLIDAATGALLAGPKDLVVTTEDATFTDVIILPVGTTKVKVTANIATSVSNGDIVQIDIDAASSGIVARGMQSNDSVTPSPTSAVSGNALTVQAATLTAVTNTSPAARSIVVGQQDHIFATATLSAANSGEDVLVSAMVLEDTVNESAGSDSGAQEIDNVEIWADLTAANSARGDVYETRVADAKQFTGTGDEDATLSFNLTPTITVPKNGAITIAVVADLSSGADVSDTHTISLDTDAGDVTASGRDTGTTVSVTPTGAGQAMTVATSGALTVSVDSSTPIAGLILDNVNEHSLTTFRLAADNTENLDVDILKITDTGTNGNDVVASFKFYSGATLLGTATPDGSGNAELFLTDGTLVIPANDYKLVTVKAVLRDIDGVGFVNGDTLIIGHAATATDFETTGLASGTAVDSPATAYTGNTMTAYEAYPVVAFAADAAIGTAVTLGSGQLIAKIGVTNPGNKDLTYQSGDTNIFSIQVQAVGDDTDTAAETVTIKDQDGTTLDADSTNFVSATGVVQVDFNMSSVGAAVGTTIPAGQTKYFYIYADTSDLEDNGNVIQVWLDDTDADNTFGIGGSGAFAHGSIINRGDLFGPVLSRSI